MADLQRLKSSIAKLERLLAAMDSPESATAADLQPDRPVSLGYADNPQAGKRR